MTQRQASDVLHHQVRRAALRCTAIVDRRNARMLQSGEDPPFIGERLKRPSVPAQMQLLDRYRLFKLSVASLGAIDDSGAALPQQRFRLKRSESRQDGAEDRPGRGSAGPLAGDSVRPQESSNLRRHFRLIAAFIRDDPLASGPRRNSGGLVENVLKPPKGFCVHRSR